jgi:hypothetical protein
VNEPTGWDRTGAVHEKRIDGDRVQAWRLMDGWVYRAFDKDGRLMGWTVSHERHDADALRDAEAWYVRQGQAR